MSTHVLVPIDNHCDRCKATYEQVMDGVSCGQVRCRECTLLRVCYGGICTECRDNMAKSPSTTYIQYFDLLKTLHYEFEGWDSSPSRDRADLIKRLKGVR